MKIISFSSFLMTTLFCSFFNISTLPFDSQLAHGSMDYSINQIEDDLINKFQWMLKGKYKLDDTPIEIDFLNKKEIKGKGFSLKQTADKLFLKFDNKTYTYQDVLETAFYFEDKSTGDMIGADGVIYFFEDKAGEKVEIFRFDYKRYFSIGIKATKEKKANENYYYRYE